MFDALEFAYLGFLWDAAFDAYRADPRFQALLRRRNLPESVGDQWFNARGMTPP